MIGVNCVDRRIIESWCVSYCRPEGSHTSSWSSGARLLHSSQYSIETMLPMQGEYDGRGQQTGSLMFTAILSGRVGISGIVAESCWVVQNSLQLSTLNFLNFVDIIWNYNFQVNWKWSVLTTQTAGFVSMGAGHPTSCVSMGAGHLCIVNIITLATLLPSPIINSLGST